MTLFWLLSLVNRLGRKIIARDTMIPPERKMHVIAVMAAQGALAASVAASIHNPWLYAAHWLGAAWGALVALRRAQRWESEQHARPGRPAW
jgi:hypothetical protein